jgi:hypothetical protein
MENHRPDVRKEMYWKLERDERNVLKLKRGEVNVLKLERGKGMC